MSLTNTLLTPPIVSSDGHRRKYIVNEMELQQGGAFTTVDIILETFPAGAIIESDRIKHLESVEGAGPITASTARLYFGKSGSLSALGAGALDVFAAPGSTDGTHSISGVTPVSGDVEDENLLVMRVTTTGGNLSGVTAGIIQAIVNVTNLTF